MKSLVLVALFIIGLLFVGAAFQPTLAQDELVTNTPVAESTDEPVVTDPLPAPVPEPPAPPAPIETAWWSPYIGITAIVMAALVVMIVSQQMTIRGAIVQLGASMPGYVYAGGKTALDTGLTQLEGVVNTTSTTLDDEALKAIREVVRSVIEDIERKRFD